MNQQKIKEIQQQFMEFQKSISETTVSQNQEVSVVINGNIEIVSLTYDNTLSPQRLNELLIETINKGIKTTSLKVSDALKIANQQMMTASQ
jgi:DNA-binding protein YbaB